jgi:hypothetical protein
MSQALAALAWVIAAYAGGVALALGLEWWLRRLDREP